MVTQQIKVGETVLDVIGVFGSRCDMLGAMRNCIRIRLESNYSTVSKLFVDGITYSLISEEEVKDPDGNVVTNTYEYDKSNYSLACDIVDHRDGTLDVYMGELTTEEELLIQLYSGGVE